MAEREVSVTLPTLHPGQVKLLRFLQKHRFVGARCGRRFGKTEFGSTLSADVGLKGYPVGWFAPEHKFLIEPYQKIIETLGDTVAGSSEMKGQISLISKGKIDFWSLDNPNAGRGRKYKLVLIDEAAFGKPWLVEQWRRNIRPTLVDMRGSAIALSNTNGANQDQFFWQICNQPEHGFAEYHAPSSDNPFLPKDELEALKTSSHPLVWKQEYEAEFVDWSGVAFFSLDKMLVDGQPVAYPKHCDTVFAVVDTATKTGIKNDGTAVTWYAYERTTGIGWPMVILDWDLHQIEGASLITWLPMVFRRGEELAQECGARSGFIGAFIEDKASGSVLLQQAKNNSMPAHPIESRLSQMGKSERALNASGPFFREKIKISKVAYDKTTVYKGASRNHFVSQITGFRVGYKEEGAEDDLLDTFTYGVSLGLGNSEGF